MSRLRTRRKFVDRVVTPSGAALGRISGPNAVIIGDSAPPSVPANLREQEVGATRVTVAWDASTDSGSGIGGYRVYVDGANTPFAETTALSYEVSGLATDTAHIFRVSAFDSQGNESAQSDPLSATPSLWDGGIVTVQEVALTVGVAADIDMASYLTEEATITSVTGSVPGMAYNAETMRFAGTPTTASPTSDDYEMDFTADDGQTSLFADYQARISGPGVLWAHRFLSTADIAGYQRSAPDSGSVNSAGRTTVYDPNIQQFVAGAGVIPGDGALRQVYHGGEDWGGGAWQWRRPLQPFDTDINQPGVPTLPSTLAPWQYFQNHPEVATVMHTDYQVAHGTPSRTGVFLADAIYIQTWMKLSPGRISNDASPDGKCFMLENCYASDEAQFVMNVGPGSASAMRLYTNKGSGFNAALETVQTSGPTSSGRRQPGSQYTIPSGPYAGQSASNVCISNNRNVAGWDGMCWTFPDDAWVSLLYYWKPGHHAGSTASVANAANDGARDTTVTVWAATEDEIRAGLGYTRVHHKTDYVWRFSEEERFGSSSAYLPFGLQQILLNHFTGGTQWDTSAPTFWHQFDQIICSTQPIPCPAVAPAVT